MTYGQICSSIDTLYGSGNRGDELFREIRKLAMYRLEDEDAAQDVLVAAFGRMHTYRGAGRFHAFVNRIISDHRTRLMQEAIENRKAGEPGIEVPMQGSRISPDFCAIDHPFVRRVAELATQGFTQREIATKLNVRPETLRWRLHEYRSQHRLVALLPDRRM